MIGNSFWDDLGIDAYDFQLKIEHSAQALIDYWGKDLTQADIYKLHAYSELCDNPIEKQFAQAALTYYKTQGYEFVWLDTNPITCKRWWQLWKR
jgi:hypothetical protein